MSLVTGLFFLVLLLNQRWSPPLRLQDSHCDAFRIMCDVPSIAVFCSESIECFPDIRVASKFFLKLPVTIPVTPIITGIILHFRFHIHCISIHKLLYFNLFSASFCTTFLSAGIATSISVHVFFLLFLIIISGLFAVTSLFVCTAWFHNTVTSPSSYTGFGMCVYHLLLLLLLLLPLLGTFAKLRKENISFMSVRCSHGTTGLPHVGFSWNLTFKYFSNICRENLSLIDIGQE